MGVRRLPDRFLVAFSFAGEQRDLVRAVAAEVEARLGEPNVFFDEWWEHYLAGGDADVKLQSVYENAALAVVCVATAYGDKPWTRAEHAAIRARLMQAQQDRVVHGELGVLPIRVGDGDVPGIPFNTIVPDIRTRTAREAADLVVARLGLLGELRPGGEGTVATGPRVHRVGSDDTVESLSTRYLGSPTRWRRLAAANDLRDPVALQVGQLLEIPEPIDTDAD